MKNGLQINYRIGHAWSTWIRLGRPSRPCRGRHNSRSSTCSRCWQLSCAWCDSRPASWPFGFEDGFSASNLHRDLDGIWWRQRNKYDANNCNEIKDCWDGCSTRLYWVETHRAARAKSCIYFLGELHSVSNSPPRAQCWETERITESVQRPFSLRTLYRLAVQVSLGRVYSRVYCVSTGTSSESLCSEASMRSGLMG